MQQYGEKDQKDHGGDADSADILQEGICQEDDRKLKRVLQKDAF